MHKYLVVIIVSLILLLSACNSNEVNDNTSDSVKMEGIELQLTIDKEEYSQNEKVIASIKITNSNNTPKDFYVPIPHDAKEGIAGVIVEKKDQPLFTILNPKNNEEIQNIQGRTHYEFVHVQLGPNEKIEQEFLWNQKLINQETQQQLQAESGEYWLEVALLITPRYLWKPL